MGGYALDQYGGGVARRRNRDEEPTDDEAVDLSDEPADWTDDEPDDTDDEPDDTDDQAPPPPGISSGLRRISQWRPPPRRLPLDKTGKPLSEKQIVDGLDKRERLISGVAACLALATAVVLAIALSIEHVKKVKGQATVDKGTVLIVIVALVIPAVVMFVGVIIKRRALVGFTSFLIGFELLQVVGIFSFAYFILGGWLLLRAYRLSKQRREMGIVGSGNRRAGRAGAGPATGRAGAGGTGRAGTGRGASAAKAGSRAGSKAAAVPERKPPPRSKRYTPPKGAVPRRSTSKPR